MLNQEMLPELTESYLKSIAAAELMALAANRDVFSDVENLQRISRYVKTGQFPWEGAA